MWRDLQFGLGQLTRNKLLGGVIIALLAVGIGANTLIFSFINSLLLKPLPVRDPQTLFLLEKDRERQVRPDSGFFYRQYEEVLARNDLFSSAVAEQEFEDSSFVPLDQGEAVRMISTAIVSPNYFTELGVHAVLGRVLARSDATAASKIPVVLSYQFWQSQFDKRRNVIGRTIRIKNSPFLIVGVLPRDFHSIDIDRAPDIRLPISAAPAITGSSVWNPQGGYRAVRFHILARLAPSVPRTAAGSAIAPQLRATDERVWREMYTHMGSGAPSQVQEQHMSQAINYESNYRVALRSAARGISYMRNKFATTLLLLMGGVGLLLAAVCANVAGLLLTKGEERSREIAIRLSVGASIGRLTRQFLTENMLLAIPGTVLGLALAYLLSPSLLGLLPSLRGYVVDHATSQIITISPDTKTLLFTLAVSLVTVLLFGTLPARRASRLDVDAELKGNSRGTTQSSTGVASVAIQVALSTVLLAGAILMLQTFWNLEHLNPGFDRAHIVEFTLDTEAVGYSPQRTRKLFRELRESVSALPGVRSVALASQGIMRGLGLATTIAPRGVVLPPKTFLNTSVNSVGIHYFETMGIPLLAGRNLEERDLHSKPEPVVVNKAFAEAFFPHQNPVGKTFVSGADGTKPPTNLIVGLTGTAKYRFMHEKDTPTFYGLLSEEGSGILYVRTFGNPSAIIGDTRKLLRGLDPKVPLVEVATLEQEVQSSLWQERIVTLLSAFFGVVSLFLAAAGLYGALAYSVTRRTREIGIRLALGAMLRHILQTVCTRMIVAVLIGLGAGLIFATLLTRFLRSLLFGVQPIDPTAFLAAAGCVLACAAVAVAFPVFRAMKTDPASALRTE